MFAKAMPKRPQGFWHTAYGNNQKDVRAIISLTHWPNPPQIICNEEAAEYRCNEPPREGEKMKVVYNMLGQFVEA